MLGALARGLLPLPGGQAERDEGVHGRAALQVLPVPAPERDRKERRQGGAHLQDGAIGQGVVRGALVSRRGGQDVHSNQT